MLIAAAIPPAEGDEGFQIKLSYGTLIYKAAEFPPDEVVWPEEGISQRDPVSPSGTEEFVIFGSATSADHSGPVSNFVGTIVVLNLTCPGNVGSTTIDLLPGGIDGTGFVLFGGGRKLAVRGNETNVARAELPGAAHVYANSNTHGTNADPDADADTGADPGRTARNVPQREGRRL